TTVWHADQHHLAGGTARRAERHPPVVVIGEGAARTERICVHDALVVVARRRTGRLLTIEFREAHLRCVLAGRTRRTRRSRRPWLAGRSHRSRRARGTGGPFGAGIALFAFDGSLALSAAAEQEAQEQRRNQPRTHDIDSEMAHELHEIAPRDCDST